MGSHRRFTAGEAGGAGEPVDFEKDPFGSCEGNELLAGKGGMKRRLRSLGRVEGAGPGPGGGVDGGRWGGWK